MMRNWYLASLALPLAAALVGGPIAAADKSQVGPASQHEKSPATSTSTMQAANDFTGRHTMEGEVTRVDPKKGMLSLKTPEGTLDLHFPPSTLAAVKKGDRVAIELAMKPAGSSARPRTEGSSSPGSRK